MTIDEGHPQKHPRKTGLDIGLDPVSAENGQRRPGTRRREFVRRLFSNRLSVLGVCVLGVIIAIVVLGPLIWDVSPTAQNLTARIAPPSGEHPLGTDALGRDVLARVLHGGRLSLLIVVSAVLLSLVTGTLIGLITGFLRGVVDNIIMRIMDVIIAIPSLLLAIAIVAALGPGIRNTILAVVIPSIPADARIVRSVVISVRERDYVFAARACGVRPSRIMMRHVLANSLSTVISLAALNAGFVLLAVSGLGFLGLGVPPPSIEWGAMFADARTYIISSPIVLLAPGLAIAFTAFACHLLGDALRDAFDSSR